VKSRGLNGEGTCTRERAKSRMKPKKRKRGHCVKGTSRRERSLQEKRGWSLPEGKDEAWEKRLRMARGKWKRRSPSREEKKRVQRSKLLEERGALRKKEGAVLWARIASGGKGQSTSLM